MCIKLLFDQNLSYRLVSRVSVYYPDSKHVASLGLEQSSDKDIWQYAKDNGFVLVSKDSDFNEISTLYGFPPQIIWLRLGNSRISVAENALKKYKNMISDIINGKVVGIIEINNSDL